MHYTVIMHPAEEGGYWVEVPSLPGCFTQGETVEDALRMSRLAIRSHVQALRDDHKPVPSEKELVLARVEL